VQTLLLLAFSADERRGAYEVARCSVGLYCTLLRLG
jgi:hypothetical protein